MAFLQYEFSYEPLHDADEKNSFCKLGIETASLRCELSCGWSNNLPYQTKRCNCCIYRTFLLDYENLLGQARALCYLLDGGGSVLIRLAMVFANLPVEDRSALTGQARVFGYLLDEGLSVLIRLVTVFANLPYGNHSELMELTRVQ